MNLIMPDPGMFPHEVSITRNTWGEDLDGGIMPASSVTYADWPCFVQAEAPKSVAEDDIGTGLRRHTKVTPYAIQFREDPKLSIDDQITWIDDTGDDVPGVHFITVTGNQDVLGLRGVWEVKGEEVK